MSPTGLQETIDREIRSQGGMIPFRRFMELALYHPDQGYYSSGRAGVGRVGDFFTSVSLGRIFGQLLVSVCREVWERLGCPEEFTVVEQGGHDGALASDILSAAGKAGDPFADALQYRIVEPFAVNRNRQMEKLSGFRRVTWHDGVAELPEFTGVHLSNELLDAFPVDSLRWNGSIWEEQCVALKDGGGLCWTTRTIRDPGLTAAAQRLPAPPRIGWRFEINPGITPWLSGIASRMRRGILLTLDYGQAGEDRFAPHRADGTLLAYRNHERFDDPLEEPGRRDLTAQVDFTELARSAQECGFGILGYSDQHHFLVGAAEPWLRSLGDFTERGKQARRNLGALRTLMDPGSMGIQFKALALEKGFPNGPPLGCFKYQRPGIGVL